MLILFLLGKYRLWDIALLIKKYVVFFPKKALHHLHHTFCCLLASLLLLGFSLLGAVFYVSSNKCTYHHLDGSDKTYCSGVSQLLAQRCWHQYVCSPISVPNISTQSFLQNYLQSFVGSSLQSLFGDLGFRSQL